MSQPIGALARGVVVESVTISTQADPFYSITALARLTSISKRTLLDYIHDPEHPLPAYRLPGGGKLLVRQSEFLAWLVPYRIRPDVAALVDDTVHGILRDLRAPSRRDLTTPPRSVSSSEISRRRTI